MTDTFTGIALSSGGSWSNKASTNDQFTLNAATVGSSSGGMRIANGNLFSISANAGITIDEIVLETNQSGRNFTSSPSVTPTAGTGSANKTWTYTFTTSPTAVTFTNNGGGNIDVSSITITYTVSGGGSDTTAPTLSGSTPDDNATGITSYAEASFTFDENVQLAAGAEFTLTGGVGTVGTPSISGATITVPLSGLAYGTTYTLGLAANKVEDTSGNAYASAISKSFTTMPAPAASKTWNFKTALSETDVTNFTEGVGTSWTYDSGNSRYKNIGSLSGTILTANGKAIEKTAGLLFTTTGDDQLRVDNGTRLMIKNNTNALVVPNLKANDEVIVIFSSGNGSALRTITPTNGTLVAGSASSPNYDEVTAVFKVTADGNFSIKGSDWMRIYSIYVATNSDNAVKVTAANYATFVTQDKIDFSKSAGVTAYKAKVNGDAIDLAEVTAAPIGTPLVIAATSDSYLLTVASDTPAEVTDNDLLAGPKSDSDGSNYYVLGMEGGKVGFGLLANGVNLPATKAYIPASKFTTPAHFYPFDDETTGIKTVESKKNLFDGGFYNLSGQKVIKPAKGLYIVNGKKVVVK